LRDIVVIGAGFAGLWSSISAAGSLDDLREGDVRITVVNRDKWHGVRVRYYESDLTDARIPLNGILDPIRGYYVSEVQGVLDRVSIR